jgi:hypothetical protein
MVNWEDTLYILTLLFIWNFQDESTYDPYLDVSLKHVYILTNMVHCYRTLKDSLHRYETYISDIRNISHRNILTRFRTSNHKLHIETGRYTRPITPVENRICSNCNSKSVEDEIHFLMYCPKFENHSWEDLRNIAHVIFV